MKKNLLIIDDEVPVVNSIKKFFSQKYNVFTFRNGTSVLKNFKRGEYDIILLDLNLPDIMGDRIAHEIRKKDKDVIIIVITGHGSVQSAVNLFRIGINDYILKPFEFEELDFIIRSHLKHIETRRENIQLKRNLSEQYKPENLIGESKAMKDIHKQIIQVAEYDVSVLIQGESGTGKELVARTIHFSSSRSNKPFYAINCGAIPNELLESEFFGFRRGSFTGAISDKKGIFEEASGSSLFLDEINELPLTLQPKLLRVLQEQKIKRIGDNKEIDIDVRIISATSKILQNEVINKKFREDLFYRINVITINLPPLRERKEDIPLLISHFIKKYSNAIKKDIKGISRMALKKCMEYS